MVWGESWFTAGLEMLIFIFGDLWMSVCIWLRSLKIWTSLQGDLLGQFLYWWFATRLTVLITWLDYLKSPYERLGGFLPKSPRGGLLVQAGGSVIPGVQRKGTGIWGRGMCLWPPMLACIVFLLRLCILYLGVQASRVESSSTSFSKYPNWGTPYSQPTTIELVTQTQMGHLAWPSPTL